MKRKQIKVGLYRHYKGNLYEVFSIAQHSETEEYMVVYKALYGEEGVWVRPYEMFMESVEINGKRRERFAYVEKSLEKDSNASA